MIREIGKKAKMASRELRKLGSAEKNRILQSVAKTLREHSDTLIAQNSLDVKEGRALGLSEGLIDRLTLTKERVEAMALGVEDIIGLSDPVGEILSMTTLENGLILGKRRVSLGVIGIIYEARPNVTVDAAALCLKSSNVLILRGGKEAIHSNRALCQLIRKAIENLGYNPDFVQLVEHADRKYALALMKMNEYVDMLIPRGSGRLIQSVIENATVPVLQTGVGNCHVYVDDHADLAMACSIVENAKTQRVGVCNAMETLLVHEKMLEPMVPFLESLMDKKGLVIHADEKCCALSSKFLPATEEDWGREYLAPECALKVVGSLAEALEHIESYGSGHSEVIVTESYPRAMKFLDEVDAACVYVNASSRFTDGFEFGMGAEMGISTQKLHARGPVGLRELTTTKYIILGSGQIRK